MGLFSRLFQKSPQQDRNFYYTVKCNRCGEEIRVRMDRMNEPSPEYDEKGRVTHYIYRKDVLGQKCFNLIQVEFVFNSNFEMISSQVTGGKLIEPDVK
ncbi:MAG TPA: hypothetical protein PLK33_01055 [bacterium]|jgi:phage terminase large subunit GpA-like protein|nr:hypothetical protein [Dictyoglomota bacterium]HHV80461.1 hypothetical protein [bacterium]HOL54721.1 hypothetical protein [bacterium]HON72456.1 hypothetical protein [bacterium]HOP55294.1 hypothetical protein [bacterium]